MKSAQHCPKCGTQRVHRSHRRSRLERLARLVGASFRRCHGCNLRVLELCGCLIPTATLTRLCGRASVALLFFLATVLIIATVVWLNRFQATPPEALILNIAR